MEMITGTLKDGTKHIKIISDNEIDFEFQTVPYSFNNEFEHINYSYTFGKLIKSEKCNGQYMYWYELIDEDGYVDRFTPINSKLLRYTELVSELEAQNEQMAEVLDALLMGDIEL